MRQRIEAGLGDVGIGVAVVVRIELRPRTAPFAPTVGQVVAQRIDACADDVGIGLAVPGVVEQARLTHRLVFAHGAQPGRSAAERHPPQRRLDGAHLAGHEPHRAGKPPGEGAAQQGQLRLHGLELGQQFGSLSPGFGGLPPGFGQGLAARSVLRLQGFGQDLKFAQVFFEALGVVEGEAKLVAYPAALQTRGFQPVARADGQRARYGQLAPEDVDSRQGGVVV